MNYYMSDDGQVFADMDSPELVEKFLSKGMVLMSQDAVNKFLTPDDKYIRNKRDGMLRELDVFVANPLRWASIPESDKDELQAYRVSLLNIPEQEGFPEEVVWPEQPLVMSK